MELAREGARVAICAPHREAVEEAASQTQKATGAAVAPIVVDFGDPGASERFVAGAAEALGGLQVVVTNAGDPPPGPASQFDEAA
jgi:3-oxoacyl-[acyl-carrier protein] reductase